MKLYERVLQLLFSTQRFFSAPCSQIPSVYVSSLMSDTNFQIHTEPKAKLQFSTLWSLPFLIADKTKGSWLNGSKHCPNSISSWIKFWLATDVPKRLDLYTFTKALFVVLCQDFSLHNGDETPTCTLFPLSLLLYQPSCYHQLKFLFITIV
jgi:hypothetical protein